MLSHRRLPYFAACTLAAVSCGPASDSTNVNFGDGNVVGTWQNTPPDAGHDAANTELSGSENAGTVKPDNGNSGMAMAGRASDPSASSTAGTDSQPETAGASASAAAGSGSISPPPPANTITSLSFQVTTSPASGRYQPKNIGAIWIEDGTGKVVKSLEVWAATRRRYLTGYLGAMAGSSIDVKTSATLPRHQTHNVTWDLKDRSGATVVPGMYRLRMELTDADRTGNSNTVTFDTSKGPSSPAAPDAPSFGAMTLELR